jgi:integrase
VAVKLTERAIERLACPPGQRDSMVFDTEQRGLAVRVMAAGTKTYLAQYTTGAGRRRVPLGSVSAISLAAAREAARVVMGEVAKGSDPARERKAAAEAARTSDLRERTTLSKMVADLNRLHLSGRRPGYRAEATRAIEKAFVEWWHRPAERLERQDVVAVLDAAPSSMARSIAAYGRACFAWAHSRGAVQHNPFYGIRLPPDTKRDRVLSDPELARVWVAARATLAPYGPIVAMLILTAQRRDEVSGMAWSELSDDLTTWTIPGERTKNGLPSVVPLSAAADALIGTRKSGRGLVFPGEGGKPTSGWSKRKKALDKASGVTGWTLHDLRRTAATGLQRLGVRLEVTEAILNHVAGSRRGVVGIYQRHDWAEEKRVALDAWAEHVIATASSVSGSHVEEPSSSAIT